MSPKHALYKIDKRTDPPTMIHSDFTAIDLARSNVSKRLNDRSQYAWSKPAVCFPPSGSNSCKKWGAKHLNIRFLVSTTTMIPVDVMVGCFRMTTKEVPFPAIFQRSSSTWSFSPLSFTEISSASAVLVVITSFKLRKLYEIYGFFHDGRISPPPYSVSA